MLTLAKNQPYRRALEYADCSPPEKGVNSLPHRNR